MALNFNFTEEQKMLEDSVYKWAVAWLEPQMEHAYEADVMPEGLFLETGKLGINGIVFEEKYGGSAMGYVETLLAYETIARVSNALSMTVGASQTLCFDNFRRNATEKQKMEVLPKSCTGEYIGCLGITEPNAGSDAMSMKTRAIKKGDKWVINGSKIFITNGPVADFMVFYAKTDPDKGPHGISTFFCYPKKTKGWSCEKIKKWGMRTSPTGLVTFEDMELPEENLIGGLNKGVAVLTSGLCTERITLSGCTLGSMRSCLELSLKYAQERVQFGKPIATFQAIQFKLADMATELDAAELLLLRAAWMEDKGMDYEKESAMAKMYASDVAMRAAIEGVQIFGGYGYCKEYPAERHMRDAKICQIYEGTNEIQRVVIARKLLR